MKLAGDYKFDAAVADVWEALFDPAVLAAVLPGCEKLELVDGAYVGELKIKIGPVQGNFTGKVGLADIVKPESYTMDVDGRGAPGFVKAVARVRVEPDGEGTRLFYDADASIGGKIASVGQRLLDASARAIVKQSLDGLNGNIKLRVDAHRTHAASAEALAEPASAAAAMSAIEPAGALAVATADPTPEPPKVDYKRVEASQLARAVSKEVAKMIVPVVVLVVAIAGVVYLVLR
jgi:uncharacterized protein